MIRSALFHSVRCASRSSSISPARRVAPCLSASLKSSVAPSNRIGARYYAAAAGLQEEEVQGRIMDLLKNFDKVKDTTKLSPEANFGNDLGLDSLDTVEVVMAIEEEFSIEIPDKEADAILSIDKAVDYILKQPDAH